MSTFHSIICIKSISRGIWAVGLWVFCTQWYNVQERQDEFSVLFFIYYSQNNELVP